MMARTKRTDPAPEPQEASTALALPDTPALIAAYRTPEQMTAILARIEREALSHAPDLTTATGRKAIASLAFKVARSKTTLDDIGKELTEDARKQIDAVNALRRDVRDRLDALKVEVRKPLDEWEAAEAARIADLEDRLKDFTDDLPGAEAPAAEIEHVLAEITAIPIDDTWSDFRERADAAKANAVHVLTARLAAARQREAERAELERLRAEKEAREAEEQRRLAQERAAAEAARIEREKAEAAERAAKAEHERAERESREREERHQREIAAAEARIERERTEAAERERLAAQRERERIAAEQVKAEADRRAREADQARRAQVFSQIAEAMSREGADDTIAGCVTEAIMAGRIPHVKVEM
jgi:chromosome segregation ATPase